MEICLHLGAHRTGTTTFQTMLHRNRDLLAGQGVIGWGPQKLRRGALDGLIKHPDFMNADDLRRGNRSSLRLRRELDTLRAQGRNHVIVSEENMIGTMTQNFAGLSLYAQARPRLERFRLAFRDVTRVSLGIRSYDSYWASLLAFKIRDGAGLPDGDTLDRLAYQPRGWRDVAHDVARVFPKAELMILPFEQMMSDPAYMLAVHVGERFDTPFWVPPKACNASPSAADLADILADNGDMEAARHVEQMSDRFQPFDADLTQKMQDDYAADLAWFASEARGQATLITPNGEHNPDGLFDRQGSQYDRSKERLGRPSRKRTPWPNFGRSDVA